MEKQQIIDNIKRKGTFLCVGLDTDMAKIPECVKQAEDPIFEFNRNIIDATAQYCIAYKPNLAFYESQGYTGLLAFEKTVNYIKSNYPDQLIIADAKRGDIGNTAKLYAQAFFDHYGVDAVTVAPYMGSDSAEPFLEYPGKWTVLLALTSNKSSKEFQMLTDKKGCMIFEDVLVQSQTWNNSSRLMYVAGATQGANLARVRRLVPSSFLLIPGIGSQGGSLEDVCKYAMTKEIGIIVNASRSIIYASNGDDYAEKAAQEAAKLAQEMKNEMLKASII